MKNPWRRGLTGSAVILLIAGFFPGAAFGADATESLLAVFGDREANIEVNLSPPLLALFSESVKGQDDDFAAVLRGLRMVKVRVFELGDSSPRASLRSGARKVISDLGEAGWETVVRVRDESDQVDILVLNEGDAVGGLVAFFMDHENAGFVSIDGRFDPGELGRLASKLSLGSLAGLDLESTEEGDEGEPEGAASPGEEPK